MKPLEGKRILVSRPQEQAKGLIESIEKLGGEVVKMPLIELVPLQDQKELYMAFNQLEKYHWLVFTSANAVRLFFKEAEDFDLKFYFYPELKIATVGEKTKLELEQLGFRTNFVPIQSTAEVLAENMDVDISGKHILIPRSEKASNEYLNVFEKRGAKTHAVTIYKNQRVVYEISEVEKLFNRPVDYLTFTSGSTVKAFDHYINKMNLTLNKARIVCIGPSTAKVARALGYTVSAVAEPHNTEGLVTCIKKLETHVQTT